jgi:nucleotide-binding universal stress UspA family protein
MDAQALDATAARPRVSARHGGLSATATLLEFARNSHVDLIVIGAPGPGQRKLA